MRENDPLRTSPTILPGDVPQDRKLHLLQALRCVAASLVVVDHSLRRGVEYGAISDSWVHYSSVSGALGVYTFFVISGLIMYRTSGQRFGSGAAALDFVRRRVIRVVPLYWLATLAWVLVFPPDSTWSGSLGLDTVLSLLFVPYPITGDLVGPVLGVGWSLNYEMFFYAVFAAALVLPRRAGLGALVGLMVALAAAGTAGVDLFYASQLLLLFVAGIAIGYVEPRISARTRSLASSPGGRVVVVAAAVALLAWTVPERDEGTLAWWVRFLIVPVTLVLACTVADVRRGNRVLRLLEIGGDTSYSTYLFHSLVLSVAAKVYFAVDPVGGVPAALGFVLAGLVASNISGWVIYRHLERPMTRRLNGHVRTS